MPADIDIDGLAVLRAIVGHAQSFPDIGKEINKVARSLTTKQLKAKSMSLDKARTIRDAIGGPAFVLVVDGMTDAETKALATKLDRHHPELEDATADWRRRRIIALAGSEAQPEPKPAKRAAKKAPVATMAPEPPKIRRALSSKSAEAVWKRKVPTG